MPENLPSMSSLQLLLVHAAYGRAMISAHDLEMQLSAILMCHLIENEVDLSVEQIRRMTLGQLVRKFTSELKPSSALEEELDNMVYFRNELAHRASAIITRAATHEEWHERAITELGEIESYFLETKLLLSPYFEKCYEITKISKDKIYEIASSLYPGIKVGG